VGETNYKKEKKGKNPVKSRIDPGGDEKNRGKRAAFSCKFVDERHRGNNPFKRRAGKNQKERRRGASKDTSMGVKHGRQKGHFRV